MKLAFVSQTVDKVIPPYQTSVGIWTFQVTRRLAESNEVIVYMKRDSSTKEVDWSEGKNDNLQYRSISVFPRPISSRLSQLYSYFPRRQLPFFASDLYDLEYILQVAYDLKKQGCDVVHIQNFSQFAPLIRVLVPGIKVVLHMRCEWLTQLNKAIVERRLRHVDLIIGCSEYITEKIRCRFPHLANRCFTVYNGVDVDLFAGFSHPNIESADGLKQLLFVGRVAPEKGVHVLLDAFQMVLKYYPKVQLNIVGPIGVVPVEWLVALSEEAEVLALRDFYQGKPKEHWQIQLYKRASECADRVIFHGKVPHSQIYNHYQNADILINPSFSESFGRSLIEAMASEVPVVATRIGGMVEIVEQGKTGLLVERGNPQALAESILYLLENEEIRKSMGKLGRIRVLERFAWEQIIENLLVHYRNLCGKK